MELKTGKELFVFGFAHRPSLRRGYKKQTSENNCDREITKCIILLTEKWLAVFGGSERKTNTYY